jgi:phage terminase small subunit
MNWEEIRNEWETSKITLKDLAAKHDIKEGTLKSRKSREGWTRDATQPETQRKKVASKKEVAIPKKVYKEQVEAIVESDELTDKQRLFCMYYIKTFNQTMAAIKAGYSPDRAHITGSELVRNRKVAEEIKRLKTNMTQDIFIDAMDVLNKWVKIAFADITDFLTFGRKNIEVGEDEEGDPITAEVNYVEFKDSYMVDGSLISEVKQGKDGVAIKLADKMKALEKLSLYFDLFPDNFKRQIEEEKLKLAKVKVGENNNDTQENEIADMLRKMVERDGA